jgi:hypothetical protein
MLGSSLVCMEFSGIYHLAKDGLAHVALGRAFQAIV